jgi:two-component system OmpR family sensor kinase/two-component system sensor histidine kinase BaeS
MSPLRSLWVKLLAAFVLVAIVGVALVALLANRTTAHQFQLYIGQGRRQRAERLVPALAEYYARAASWTGVDAWLRGEGASLLAATGQSQGTVHGQGGGQVDRLIVSGLDGQVLADSEGTLLGKKLSPSELALGVPIMAGGQMVGTLFIPAAEAAETLEREFLSRVNQALLWAGLAATALAVVLGLILARQLTAPLRALTQAANRLAETTGSSAGEPSPPALVHISSRDEIGQLGHAFNQMSESLTRQETLRRNLMADIAHELRTPLSVMRGDLEALLDGLYEPTPEALASLQEETLLLSRLVDDLRALAQAEAGQLRLERQPTDLAELLRGVIAAFDLRATGQQQHLSLELPPHLDPVHADPQRVRQVVANLVSNALRHAAAPGTQVIVSATQEAGEALVSVSDNGPGIPAADLPHVFDRFWRGQGSRQDGSGLGLAIARELVRVHGGRIWAESEPGSGTTFFFTLPLVSQTA